MTGKTGRRKRGEGGLHQRADGLWIGTIELGWGADGKRKRKQVSAKTQPECLRKMRELQKSVEHGVVPSNATVEQWMRHWMESESVARLRETTARTYRGYVENWIIPQLGRKRLDRLTPEDVERLMRTMREAGKASGSQRQVRAILQSALKVAMLEQKVVRNVAALAAPPKGEAEHHEHLELEDARALMRYLAAEGEAGDWWTCSRFLVALLAGLRQGEALGLTWDHVVLDVPEPYVVVEQSVQRLPGQGLVVTDVKSLASHRTVPLMAPAAAALQAGRVDSGGRGFVWGGDAPTDPRADWQRWRDALAGAGVPMIPLHGARATTASILFAADVSDLTVSRILGHSQVQITRDRYIRSSQAQHVTAMDRAMRMMLGE